MEEENKIGNSAIEQAINMVGTFVSGIADGVDNVIQENEKLKAENARYRAALEFYADPWRPDEEKDDDIGPWCGDTETGHIAREALNIK